MHAELEKAFSLSGRVAVVTGAASGIGRETALVLARAGARVVVADVHEDGVAEVATKIEMDGGTALSRRVDVSERAQVDTLADQVVIEMGRVDVWVNAAGIIVHHPIAAVMEAELDRVLAINLKGVYWGCAAAGRVMAKGGSIVNISSGGGESAVPGLSLYSMSKAGVNMLTRTVAKEFGPHGIRANAVAPGFVETPMVAYRYRNTAGEIDTRLRDEVLRQRAQASPLGLTGTPMDIALAILYLASDASRFVTGQILRPNGGVFMP